MTYLILCLFSTISILRYIDDLLILIVVLYGIVFHPGAGKRTQIGLFPLS